MRLRHLILVTLFITSTACGSGGGGRFGENDHDYSQNDDECSEQVARIADLEEQIEQARSQLSSLENRRDQLQAAADELRGNVDRLSTESWRDVVPYIDSSSENVELESSQMSVEIDDTSETLGER
jgi:peptidoglycan hydrolase CwlO-like protein